MVHSAEPRYDLRQSRGICSPQPVTVHLIGIRADLPSQCRESIVGWLVPIQTRRKFRVYMRLLHILGSGRTGTFLFTRELSIRQVQC